MHGLMREGRREPVLYSTLFLRKFEALRQFNAAERVIAEGVLDSLIVQHQAKRLFGATPTTTPAPPRSAARRGEKRVSR